MRLEIDLTDAPGGRPAGTVGPVGGPNLPFSGWLELLRALEAHADALLPHDQTIDARRAQP